MVAWERRTFSSSWRLPWSWWLAAQTETKIAGSRLTQYSTESNTIRSGPILKEKESTVWVRPDRKTAAIKRREGYGMWDDSEWCRKQWAEKVSYGGFQIKQSSWRRWHRLDAGPKAANQVHLLGWSRWKLRMKIWENNWIPSGKVARVETS